MAAPRGHREPPPSGFDWNQVPPILKVIGVVVTISTAVFAGASAYYSIIGRLDKFENQQVLQGKTLESLALSIKTLADKAATGEEVDAKIERACFQMQIANQGKWTCPFAVAANPAATPRPFRTKTTEKASP
jgi:hypothetical protein